MRFLGKMLLTTLVGVFIQSTALANDDAQITRYEQAKLRLSYEGNVGNLLQQLSQRLKVGFIAYDIDITQKVSIQNNTETSIKSINQQIEKQLSGAEVRFERIGERLFMVISAKGAEPLFQNTTQESQFVGDVVFDNEVKTTEETKQVNAENPAAETSNTESDSAVNKVQAIFNTATNKDNLNAAKSKKSPQYKTSTKENLGLKNIRVTPLGTFLIFDSKVETSKLKVKGKFEDMAQGENIIAILHQNKDAPTKIEIENSQGKKLILEAHTATASKNTKK